MALALRACGYGCNRPFRSHSRTARGHADCYKAALQAGANALNFEPARAPTSLAEFSARPFQDPRNNFKFPAYNKGVKKRDLDLDPIRVAVFDIETTGLDASMGRVLCAVAQFYGPREKHVWRADSYPEWKTGRRGNDRALIADILGKLEQADIVIAHNGLWFDMAFLRTRALIHGLPPVHPKKIIDPMQKARKEFRFHRNSLDAISTVLGTKDHKTPLNPNTWAAAMFDGDKAAMDEIVAHCEADVEVLAEVARKMAPFVRQIDAIGSWRG